MTFAASCARPFGADPDTAETLIGVYGLVRPVNIPRFAYVPLTGGNIGAYTVGRTSGLLSFTAAYVTGLSPSAVVADATNRFAYATGGTSLYAATIDQTTGALATAGTTATGAAPSAPRIDSTNRFLYLVSGPGTIAGYTINSLTGALTAIGSWSAASPYSKPVLHPSAPYLYLPTNSGIYQYSIDQTTGALTQIGIAVDGGAAGAFDFDNQARFAYHAYSSSITVYAIGSNGVLTQIQTIGGISAPSGLILEHPSNRFAYLTSIVSGSTVMMYLVNPFTGLLTPTGSVNAGTTTGALRVEPSGRFAYVSNQGSSDISQYYIDQIFGTLTYMGSAASGAGAIVCTPDPTGRFFYSPNLGASSISVFSIDYASGFLRPIQTISPGGGPTYVGLVSYSSPAAAQFF